MTMLLLAGCATGYHSENLLGGYHENVSSDTAVVTFKGNGLITPEKTYQYAMKHAAEVTMQCGYDYFVVLSHRSYLEPVTSYTTAGEFTHDFPRSEIKIQFVQHKTENAYDAKQIFSEIQ